MSLNFQTVKIKDWNYIKKHNKFISAVPEMEPFCGKNATIVDTIAVSPTPEIPSIYSIFEDGGKHWWSQEWLENVED